MPSVRHCDVNMCILKNLSPSCEWIQAADGLKQPGGADGATGNKKCSRGEKITRRWFFVSQRCGEAALEQGTEFLPQTSQVSSCEVGHGYHEKATGETVSHSFFHFLFFFFFKVNTLKR